MATKAGAVLDSSCAFVLQPFAYPHWKSIGDGKKDKSLI
jgi:hypothetical protein